MLNNIYYIVDKISIISLYIVEIYWILLVGILFIINTINLSLEGFSITTIKRFIENGLFLIINFGVIYLIYKKIYTTSDIEHSIVIIAIILSANTGNQNFCEYMNKYLSVW